MYFVVTLLICLDLRKARMLGTTLGEFVDRT